MEEEPLEMFEAGEEVPDDMLRCCSGRIAGGVLRCRGIDLGKVLDREKRWGSLVELCDPMQDVDRFLLPPLGEEELG